ncbi:MAG TPA: D-alanine--D-alanine ligase [Actinomycetota bacterium]|nr:D-alanine--D-alanine ligase [Actinomycetota bacterium]
MARVGVVRGGRSLERQFSLDSGHNVATALRSAGHESLELDVDENLTQSLRGMDCAFVALHGRDGEDGTIQSVLDAFAIPYTGSDRLACHLCFDKPVASGVLRRAGIATPDSFVVHAEAVRHMGAGAAMGEAAGRLGYPIVVKPATQGSGLGVGVVREPEELPAAAMTAFNNGDRILLERFIQGVELAVTVLQEPGRRPRALPPVQISTEGVFDFRARVTPGAATYTCPADIREELLEAACGVAVSAFEELGARDFARVDLIVSEERGAVVLEVNPCPGLTETSLLPLAVRASGGSFEDFASSVVDAAIVRGEAAH